jgi:hypothetical protein
MYLQKSNKLKKLRIFFILKVTDKKTRVRSCPDLLVRGTGTRIRTKMQGSGTLSDTVVC